MIQKIYCSGREENCIRDVSYTRILGIAAGYDLVKHLRVRNLEGSGHNLDTEENKILHEMVRTLGLGPNPISPGNEMKVLILR